MTTSARTWSVEVEHRVHGSPETVFSYFTDPEKYRRWKGVDAELDARPGGIYRVTMAPGVWVRGRYLAVEPPRRLLISWGFEGTMPLPEGLGQVAPGSSTVELNFIEDGDGTVVRLRHTGLPSEKARWAHRHGWDGYLPRLVAVAAGEDPGEDPLVRLAPVLYERDAEDA